MVGKNEVGYIWHGTNHSPLVPVLLRPPFQISNSISPLLRLGRPFLGESFGPAVHGENTSFMVLRVVDSEAGVGSCESETRFLRSGAGIAIESGS